MSRMPRSLMPRLARLEAQLAVTHTPYTPPEAPSGWCEEVLRLLRAYGYLNDTLRSWGLTETEIAAVYAAVEEIPADALTP